MTECAGVLRSAAGLARAVVRLDALRAAADAEAAGGRPAEPGVEAWETTNLHLVARVLAAAALRRTETRGCHWREDHPERDDADLATAPDPRAALTRRPRPPSDGRHRASAGGPRHDDPARARQGADQGEPVTSPFDDERRPQPVDVPLLQIGGPSSRRLRGRLRRRLRLRRRRRRARPRPARLRARPRPGRPAVRRRARSRAGRGRGARRGRGGPRPRRGRHHRRHRPRGRRRRRRLHRPRGRHRRRAAGRRGRAVPGVHRRVRGRAARRGRRPGRRPGSGCSPSAPAPATCSPPSAAP